MNLKNLQNKKIALLGLGMENYALLKYLLKHEVKGEITICDMREKVGAMHASSLRRYKIHWQLGKNFKNNLGRFDILFRSPGWPIKCPSIIGAMRASSAPILSSPIKLFLDLCPTKNIIGVTGTKGKGTTASLIYQILKVAGKRVWLGGNIGVAPFKFIDKIKKNDWVVLELSSFQLEDMTVSPQIAVITNFYPEHLAAADPNNPNYHKSLKEYWQAKANILRWQNKDDWAIINSNLKSPAYQSLALAGRQNSKLRLKAKKVYFNKSTLPSQLVGEHNKENIAAAVAVARVAGVKDSAIKKAVANFKGLEHRLELVRTVKGVKYYNDSFATTPEATIIAIKSFNQPIILLLGGADKRSDFKKLAKEVKDRVKFTILLVGAATARIKKELLAVNFPANKMKLVYNIREAVRQAQMNSVAGDIVMLSPACASFGMFKNYKERGGLFKKEVMHLNKTKLNQLC